MKNEFGEETSENFLRSITKRIRSLSNDQIDEFWFNCGFIISDRENNRRALRDSDLEKIRKSFDLAKNVVWSLLAETSLHKVLDELEKLEG